MFSSKQKRKFVLNARQALTPGFLGLPLLSLEASSHEAQPSDTVSPFV